MPGPPVLDVLQPLRPLEVSVPTVYGDERYANIACNRSRAKLQAAYIRDRLFPLRVEALVLATVWMYKAKDVLVCDSRNIAGYARSPILNKAA